MKHEKLITSVIDLLSKNHPEIKEQYQIAKKDESCDEYGFFLDFSFEQEPKNLIIDEKTIKDVGGLNNEGDCLIDFILFVENGKIKMLEGSSYDEWPESDDNIKVKYIKVKRF